MYKRLCRFFSVLFSDKKIFIAYFVYLIGKLPIINYRYISYKPSPPGVIGYADGKRNISLCIKGHNLCSIDLLDEIEIQKFHFYISRSMVAIKELMTFYDHHSRVCLDNNSTIIELGCGSGLNISYLIDKYGGYGIGIDNYAPAYHVSRLINRFNDIDFYLGNATNIQFVLDKIKGKKVTLVLFNSFLAFIDNTVIVQLINTLKYHTESIAGVEKYNDLLYVTLKSLSFEIERNKDRLLFYLDCSD